VPTDATDTRSVTHAVDEFIPQTLMIPLAMTMVDKLCNGSPKLTFTERNEAVAAFLSNRPNKSLGVRVRIRCSTGSSHDAESRIAEPHAGRFAPFCITIANQHPTRTRVVHRQRSRDLAHERLIRMRR